MAITFVLTVVADLIIAVEVGMALAALLYINRVAQTATVSLVTPEYVEHGCVHVLQDKVVPPYVSILRIHGPFLVGVACKLADETTDLNRFQSIVVLRLRNMTAIDATGLHAIRTLARRLKASGRTLVLCGARHQPADLLKRADIEHIWKSNICPHVTAALRRAEQIHAAGGTKTPA